MNETILFCRELKKTFGHGAGSVEVLRGINLELQAQEHIAIVGASGSGKSTFLHLLGGLDSPSSGSVHLAGYDLRLVHETKRSELRNRHLGFIYQFHHLLADFSAWENVAIPLLIARESIIVAQEAAMSLLNRVGLGHRLEHRPGELSGGERQRVAIARAMITRPACVLADEPTGNLDRENAKLVFDLLLQLNAEYGSSLIIVTHDLELAARAQRVMQIADGLITEKSPATSTLSEAIKT